MGRPMGAHSVITPLCGDMFAEVAVSHACVTFEDGEMGRVSLMFSYFVSPGYIQNSLPASPPRYEQISHLTVSPDAFCQKPRLYAGLSMMMMKWCDMPKKSSTNACAWLRTVPMLVMSLLT